MQWYLWLLVILLVIAVIAAVLYILHLKGVIRLNLKKRPMHEDYVWLGQGDHPFKETKEKK